jgi:flagellar export protein FliJ
MKARTLQTLIDLEQRRLDDALAAFQQMDQALVSAKAQTRQLDQFLLEYQQRSPVHRTNAQAVELFAAQDHFTTRLGQAINTQKIHQAEIEQHRNDAQSSLAEKFKRLQGLKKLQTLEAMRKRKRQGSLEQHFFDELAARRVPTQA